MPPLGAPSQAAPQGASIMDYLNKIAPDFASVLSPFESAWQTNQDRALGLVAAQNNAEMNKRGLYNSQIGLQQSNAAQANYLAQSNAARSGQELGLVAPVMSIVSNAQQQELNRAQQVKMFDLEAQLAREQGDLNRAQQLKVLSDQAKYAMQAAIEAQGYNSQYAREQVQNQLDLATKMIPINTASFNAAAAAYKAQYPYQIASGGGSFSSGSGSGGGGLMGGLPPLGTTFQNSNQYMGNNPPGQLPPYDWTNSSGGGGWGAPPPGSQPTGVYGGNGTSVIPGTSITSGYTNTNPVNSSMNFLGGFNNYGQGWTVPQ